MCPFTRRRCYEEQCPFWHLSYGDCMIAMAVAKYCSDDKEV